MQQAVGLLSGHRETHAGTQVSDQGAALLGCGGFWCQVVPRCTALQAVVSCAPWASLWRSLELSLLQPGNSPAGRSHFRTEPQSSKSNVSPERPLLQGGSAPGQRQQVCLIKWLRASRSSAF